jgi:hypothetical protein
MNPKFEGEPPQDGSCKEKLKEKETDEEQKKWEETVKRKINIKIGYINCNGIRGKTAEIKEMITKEKIDILGCSETWLRTRDQLKLDVISRKDDIPENNKDAKDRNTRGKRGICIVNNKETEKIKWELNNEITPEFIEIRIYDIDVIFIYFPPSEINEHLKKLEDVLNKKIKNLNQEIIILGDFNINAEIKRGKGKEYAKLEEMMEKHGLYRIIYEEEECGIYTHYHKNGGSIIDHIWSNIRKSKANIISEYLIGDHELITIDILTDKKGEKLSDKKETRRIIRPSNKQSENKGLVIRFNNELFKNSEKIISSNKPLEDKYIFLKSNLVRASDKIFKVKSIKHKRIINENLELPKEIKYWLKVRQNMKKMVYKTKKFEELDSIRRLIKTKIKELKITTWKKYMIDFNKLESSKMVSMFSRIVKSESIMNKTNEDINEKLKKIFPYQRAKSGMISYNFSKKNECTNKKIQNAPNILKTDFNEMEAIIKGAKNMSAPGKSGITYECFKIMDKRNVNIWVEFFNQCLDQYKIIQEWCSAITIAIPKKGGGCRPITLLETPRKIFEKIIYNRMINDIKINKKQYGFMKKRNTILQIINLEAAIKNMRCKKMCICFLDITKAYDTVDRKKLFEKLEKNNEGKLHKGVIKILELLFNFNCIRLIGEGEQSNEIWLERGLIQGSKISPILYNVFIDDITNKIESITKTTNTAAFLYADDIAIISKTNKGMKRAIREATDHSKINKYQFNVGKSATMCKDNVEIKINNETIKKVKSFEYLGMEFNIHGFDLKAQIEKNIKKTRRKWFKAENAGFMNAKDTSMSARLMFLKGILLPTLEYGLEFSVAKKSYFEKIQKTVNYYMRRVLGVSKSSKTESMCWILGIEPRNLHYERKLKKLGERIFEEKGYTYEEIEKQHHLPKNKKCPSMNIITELRQSVFTNKKENLKRLSQGGENPKRIIMDLERCTDKTLLTKYLVDDCYKVINNVFHKIITVGIEKKELIEAIGNRNYVLIKNFKSKLIKMLE